MVVTSTKFFSEKQSLKYNLIEERSVPDVELVNYLSFDSKNVVSGSVVGFVKFINEKDQPRNLRQYIKIDAINKFDSDGNQLFLEQDIIKMEYLAPKYFDQVYLKVINISKNRVTLTDSDNNLFFIDKVTKGVGMFDLTGDKTNLITSDYEFTQFMRKFLN